MKTIRPVLRLSEDTPYRAGTLFESKVTAGSQSGVLPILLCRENIFFRRGCVKQKISSQRELNPDLLEKAASGDTRAFTDIVRRYEQTVFSFAFKVCRDRRKASETLQDTFINVYRKLDQFDRKSKFTTWLYSIVTNSCLMKHRKSKLEEAALSIDEIMPAGGYGEPEESYGGGPILWKSSPLEKVMNGELKELLDRAIQKLPLEYRAVFILRDVEGQSAEETGKILKLSVPAVKSRLRHARVFLREQLNEYMTS